MRVVVTVGPDGDPAAFGSLPNNASVHRYVPQTELLPQCSLVVSHAGSGTFLAALDHGSFSCAYPSFSNDTLAEDTRLTMAIGRAGWHNGTVDLTVFPV